ncbi:MAG: hypothetical protein HZA50_17230 [Planctomycetes bacterium]|nr:hypothetical protein [Planctomycetota bacterium]
MIEMIAAVAMIGATINLVVPLCNMIFVEMPKAHRTFNAHSQVVNVLDALARDMDSATDLPDRIGQTAASINLILIRTPGGDVAYRLDEGKITRAQLDAAGREVGRPSIWHAPGAKIKWGYWRMGGRISAIEVGTCIEVTIDGHKTRKFINSHVFFLKAGGAAGGGK